MTEVMPQRTREAYDTIKRRIIELSLPPGASFTEGELAAVLKVSKTPVREALVRLRQEGLVEALPRSGYRVAPVTIKHAQDLFQLRALLESEAVAIAAARSDIAAIAGLEKMAKQGHLLTDKAGIKRSLRQNTQFHVGVARLSGNEMLARMLQQVLEQLERLFHIGLTLHPRGEHVDQEHRELLAAIKAGDAETARAVALEQAARSRLMVLNALLSSDAVLRTNILAVGE